MEDMPSQPTDTYAKRPLWQWILLYLVLAAVIYGLLYYFVFAKKQTVNQAGMYQSPTAPQQPTVAPTTQASPSAVNATKVTIVGTEFSFTPSSVSVKKGETVELTFKNSGTYPHNLTITNLGIATKTIQPGQTDTITFAADKAGSFDFLCTVPGHADRGMKGTLLVQ